MKTLFTSIFLLLALSLNGYAEVTSQSNKSTHQSYDKQTQACQSLKDSGASSEQLARRGCCSWHEGVCGCSSGQVVCCDGSYSPTCTCHKADEGKFDL